MTTFVIENYIDYLNEDVDEIHLTNAHIVRLPDLFKFKSITTLKISNNHLLYLPTLPITLIELDCSYNKLSVLPILPDGLEVLNCAHN